MSEACQFEGGSGCLTHSTVDSVRLPTKNICDLGLASLRRQLSDLDFECGKQSDSIIRKVQEIDALQVRLDEQRVHIEAWYKVFGTSQLTHAQAAMEAKDAEIALLKRQKDDQACVEGGR